MKDDRYISILTRLFNNKPLIDTFLSETTEILSPRYHNYEIVLVDDGSTDGTDLEMDKLLEAYPNVRYIQLSREFGRELSLFAGMQTVIGDVTILLSIEVDPVHHIPSVGQEAGQRARGEIIRLTLRSGLTTNRPPRFPPAAASEPKERERIGSPGTSPSRVEGRTSPKLDQPSLLYVESKTELGDSRSLTDRNVATRQVCLQSADG